MIYFKIEVGAIFKDAKRDITITDRKYETSNRVTKKYYKYKCNKCGYNCGNHFSNKQKTYIEEFWIEEINLKKGHGCSCCCIPSQIVVEGINDIPTTAKFMVKYFPDSNEAKKYTHYSRKKINAVCPECGTEKSIRIAHLYENDSIGCGKCGDGISYPHKFMFNMLSQLIAEFDSEKRFDWCKYILNNKLKQGVYDFHFYLGNKEYIIEMDGHFHKKDNNMSGQNAIESELVDETKDKLARENGIEVIRIDCNYGNKNRYNYIKNKILEKLSEVFDLNTVDFDKCNEYACSNLSKLACKCKRDNPEMSTSDIGRKLGEIHQATIVRWLKQGTDVGWCDYNPIEERRRGILKSNITNRKLLSKPVLVIETGQVFESAPEIEREYKKLGIKLTSSRITLVCLGKRLRHNGLTFKYV